MASGSARKALIAAALLLVLAPASASAYTVTVHVHGAGTVSEVTNRTGGSRNLPGCTFGPTATANTTTTDCVMGSEAGLWSYGDIVRLGESVSTTAAGRGWRFDHWTDSSASGFVNCDPQDATGDFTSPLYCEFQVFQDLQVNLWFKDSTGPQDTAIAGGPAQGSTTASTTAQFTSFLATSDPDATFQCRLDPPGNIGAFTSCPKNGATFSNLTQNGTWQITVRAVDPSGNVDTTPAARSWVVDTTPPVIHLTSGPAEGSTTNATTASFNVSTSDGTLVCTLDGATLSSCAPPTIALGGLNDGQHTLSVRGKDAVGNQSAAATRTWTVDTTPPTVTINGGPTGPTNATTATFTVTTSDGTPVCTLDGDPAACSGAHGGLVEGLHTFTAAATDAAGNQASAVRHWSVDTGAPDVALLSGPAPGSTTATSSASFTFGSSDPSATFQCKLDLGPFAPCTSPLSLAGLPNGDHTFSVRAVDAAGNTSPAASRGWTVNNRDQDHDGFSTPLDCNDAGAAIHPGAPDVPGDGIDQDCDGKDAKVPGVPGGIRYKFSTLGARTTVVVLKLRALTAPRTKVTVTCKGKGCAFRSIKAKPGRSHTLDVRKLLGRKPLKAGQTLTVRISAAGYRAKAAKFTMRRGKLPKGGAFRPA